MRTTYYWKNRDHKSVSSVWYTIYQLTIWVYIIWTKNNHILRMTPNSIRDYLIKTWIHMHLYRLFINIGMLLLCTYPSVNLHSIERICRLTTGNLLDYCLMLIRTDLISATLEGVAEQIDWTQKILSIIRNSDTIFYINHSHRTWDISQLWDWEYWSFDFSCETSGCRFINYNMIIHEKICFNNYIIYQFEFITRNLTSKLILLSYVFNWSWAWTN